MTNYVQAYDIWKKTQPIGHWVLSHANFPEDDPRCITEGVITRDGVDVTPDQTTLDAAMTAYENDPETIIENNLQTATQNILALADKARAHADKIALCFDAIVSAEEAGGDADETFTRITTALNDAIIGNGFRNLVMTAFTAKTGLSFNFGNLGVVVLTTKQQFNQFAANFFTRWALMIMINRTL